MYAVPPFGYNYLSPEPPLFATPFINAAERRPEYESVSINVSAAQRLGEESGHFI